MIKFQEVPDRIGFYLAGFTDGEGSFNVVFRPREDYSTPWKISLCFNISQRDPVILAMFKKHLQCGTIRQRFDGCWYYEVNNLTAIKENVIPFFKRFGFLSAKKKRDFQKFVELSEILSESECRTVDGVRRILKIRSDMNDGGKRKYHDEEILRRFENPQRLYVRSDEVKVRKIKSELCSDAKSSSEMIEPLVEKQEVTI